MTESSPNPIRTLESKGVTENFSACPTNGNVQHHMISIKLGEDSPVKFIERCDCCGWIDESSLQWWVEDAIKLNNSERAKRIAVAASNSPFQFVQQAGEELTLEEILFQALGAASICWTDESLQKAGVFDSTRANEIGIALVREVQMAIDKSRAKGIREAATADVKDWMDLAYELYALACNSTHDEHSSMDEWANAFGRLKTRFHNLLPAIG